MIDGEVGCGVIFLGIETDSCCLVLNSLLNGVCLTIVIKSTTEVERQNSASNSSTHIKKSNKMAPSQILFSS